MATYELNAEEVNILMSGLTALKDSIRGEDHPDHEETTVVSALYEKLRTGFSG